MTEYFHLRRRYQSEGIPYICIVYPFGSALIRLGRYKTESVRFKRCLDSERYYPEKYMATCHIKPKEIFKSFKSVLPISRVVWSVDTLPDKEYQDFCTYFISYGERDTDFVKG